MSLLGETAAHQGGIVFRQHLHHFLIEVVAAGGRSVAITLIVTGAALFDVFLEAIIQVAMLAAFADLGLVVELDLIHQQFVEALSLFMDFVVCCRRLGGVGGLSNRRRRRRGMSGGSGLLGGSFL